MAVPPYIFLDKPRHSKREKFKQFDTAKARAAMDRLRASRQKPIAKVSAKQAKLNREWSKISKAAIAVVGGQCTFIEENGMRCNAKATGSHHQLPRGRGGNRQPIPRPMCWPHHDFIERNPRWARKHGYTVGMRKAVA